MTRNTDCNDLEAYIAGDLSSGEVANFAAHLEQCPECRVAVDQQQWIDGLLQSPAGSQLERTPARILESVAAIRVGRRHRILRAACGLAAAAAICIAVSHITIHTRETPPPPAETRSVAAIDTVHSPARVEPATFVSTSDAIAIPLESPAADVTVVQVFPTTDTERRWQIELALPGQLKDTNGG